MFGILFLIVVFAWGFAFGFSSNKSGSFFNKGHNAVWIEHKWVGEEVLDKEIQKLVENLEKYQIDTVFVHTGPINSDGTIDPETYKYAPVFIEKAKKANEKINYQAWLGQVRSKIDLADEKVRHNISNLTMIMTQFVGFDGVHFDIEPVWDNDTDFIKLLQECRKIMKEDKKISVALAEFIPQSIIWWLENVYKFENYNSEKNYENVSEFSDQIVVMAYDTGINKKWLYRFLLKEQTIWVTDLVNDAEVFMGIPAYDNISDDFNPKAENVENALNGVVDGLNNFRSNEENFAGIAIYPYWEMSEEEWGIYEDLWLK